MEEGSQFIGPWEWRVAPRETSAVVFYFEVKYLLYLEAKNILNA